MVTVLKEMNPVHLPNPTPVTPTSILELFLSLQVQTICRSSYSGANMKVFAIFPECDTCLPDKRTLSRLL
jgi:hypothetical protein